MGAQDSPGVEGVAGVEERGESDCHSRGPGTPYLPARRASRAEGSNCGHVHRPGAAAVTAAEASAAVGPSPGRADTRATLSHKQRGRGGTLRLRVRDRGPGAWAGAPHPQPFPRKLRGEGSQCGASHITPCGSTACHPEGPGAPHSPAAHPSRAEGSSRGHVQARARQRSLAAEASAAMGPSPGCADTRATLSHKQRGRGGGEGVHFGLGA
jgi:hypothetical protein